MSVFLLSCLRFLMDIRRHSFNLNNNYKKTQNISKTLGGAIRQLLNNVVLKVYQTSFPSYFRS